MLPSSRWSPFPLLPSQRNWKPALSLQATTLWTSSSPILIGGSYPTICLYPPTVRNATSAWAGQQTHKCLPKPVRSLLTLWSSSTSGCVTCATPRTVWVDFPEWLPWHNTAMRKCVWVGPMPESLCLGRYGNNLVTRKSLRRTGTLWICLWTTSTIQSITTRPSAGRTVTTNGPTGWATNRWKVVADWLSLPKVRFLMPSATGTTWALPIGW